MRSLREIVSQAGDGLGTFVVGGSGEGPWIQYQRNERCTSTGQPELQKGRKWIISQFMTEQEIYRTMLLAVEVYERHELLERFMVRSADGKWRRLLSPHPEGARVEGKVTWSTLF